MTSYLNEMVALNATGALYRQAKTEDDRAIVNELSGKLFTASACKDNVSLKFNKPALPDEGNPEFEEATRKDRALDRMCSAMVEELSRIEGIKIHQQGNILAIHGTDSAHIRDALVGRPLQKVRDARAQGMIEAEAARGV